MRIEKQVVGGLTTKYVYDGQTVIGEIRSDGTKRWYILGAMGYVCRIDEGANGEILARDYFVYDGLGSCRALVSSNGLVVAKYDYDVYGSVRGQEGQRANNFKYVAQIGHPTDEETGLIYMRARYYDPEIGRFISEDPNGDGVNWYLYAEGNPVNMVDVEGKIPKRVRDWLINKFILGLLIFALGTLGLLIDEAFNLHKLSPLVSHLVRSIGYLLESIGAILTVIGTAERLERLKDPWKIWSYRVYGAVWFGIFTLAYYLAVHNAILTIALFINEDDFNLHDYLER